MIDAYQELNYFKNHMNEGFINKGFKDSLGRKQGLWVSEENENVISCEYFNDVMNGQYQIKTKKGDLIYQGRYSYNQPVGQTTIWFGNIYFPSEETNFKKGIGQMFKNKKMGFWSFYNENDQMIAQGYYTSGIKHGKSVV